MHTAQSAVQKVYDNIQSLDECFHKYFALDDSLLNCSRGQWEEQLFAQLALRLKSRCVCVEADNDRFRKLRDSITAFQELPEIKPQVQVQPNQATTKQQP